jgi:pyruvate,water dikinase
MLEMFKLAVSGRCQAQRSLSAEKRQPTILKIARYLAQLGIDSISVNPSSILRTMKVVSDAESDVDLQNASKAAE